MGESDAPPLTWAPWRRATSSAETRPSFSFQLSLRTVKSARPSLAKRRVSTMLGPTLESPPPADMPRDASSQDTDLQLYVA